jgi:hypothetical protein
MNWKGKGVFRNFRILEKSFEVYDQKTRYEGSAIWVPMFSVKKKTN